MTQAKLESATKPTQYATLPPALLKSFFHYLPHESVEEAQNKEVISQRSFAETCSLFKTAVQEERWKQRLVGWYATGNNAHIDRLLKHPLGITIENIPDSFFIPRLVEFSVAANQDNLQRLLTLRPHLVARRTKFTDWNGRIFTCSPFEYAHWSLDLRYMCPMMLDCLPKDKEGNEIRITLQEQANAIQKDGLTYEFNGTLYTEKCFNLEPLKYALTLYIELYRTCTLEQRRHNWSIVVGLAEAILPAYIRQHYCDPEESFSPTPTFAKAVFKRSLEFYNYVSEQTQVWDAGLVGLSVDFAITAGGISPWHGKSHVAGGNAGNVRDDAQVDLAAIAAFEKMRTEIDLPQLNKRLATPLEQFENTPFEEFKEAPKVQTN
jgi:hypothetical protein